MRKLMTAVAVVASTAVSAITYTGQAQATELGETMKVVKVEMGAGRKPPFKRTWIDVPVTDIAAADTVEFTETVTVKSVRMGANRKPPFQRDELVVPVVDTAMAEPVNVEKSGTDFRGRPPFNRHR